jgi:hypothetical protein
MSTASTTTTTSRSGPDPSGGWFRAGLDEISLSDSVDTHWKFNGFEPHSCGFFNHRTCNIANTVQNFILMVQEAEERLSEQRVFGGAATYRDSVCRQLKHIVVHMEKLDASMEELDPPNTEETRLENMEKVFKQIKEEQRGHHDKELSDIRRYTRETKHNSRTILANQDTEHDSVMSQTRVRKLEMEEKIRREREAYEVILTTENEDTQDALNTMAADKITQLCQLAINNDPAIVAKPKINGIEKTDDGIRLQCKSPEDAKLLREADIDWNNAFTDLEVQQPSYAILVHGVHTSDGNVEGIDEGGEANLATIRLWEGNNDGIPIKDVITNGPKYPILKRKTKPAKDDEPGIQPIIIFTDDPHAADNCLKLGFFINSLRHETEKYTPELYLMQCHRCYKFGHDETACTNKPNCGNCGAAGHATGSKTCDGREFRCFNCDGLHPGFADECPKRKKEERRLAELRMATSPYFAS